MKIEWKIINSNDIKIINSWLTEQDRHNLCMATKSWEQTAFDIGDCLKYMDNAQFKNVIGYINGIPALALMFGIESTQTLNLYNIVVNPKCRHMGLAKQSLLQLLKNDKSLHLTEPYQKVLASVLPENKEALSLFKSLNFENLGFDGEYVVFKKDIIKTAEKVV